MIRNADDGRVIESEHMLPSPNLLHAYAAPPTAKLSVYQLWVVYKKGGRDFKYTIRNFATGAALDVFVDANWRNHVICWGSHGEANQTWEFYGSRRTHSCVHPCHEPGSLADEIWLALTTAQYAAAALAPSLTRDVQLEMAATTCTKLS